MKTFKRTLSCFLALLMIFGSFSVLSYATLNDGNENSAEFYTRFFVNGVETDTVEKGDTVKARVYIATDYHIGSTTFFWVYSKNFMELDLTGVSGDSSGYDATSVFNQSETSIPVTNNLGGMFVYNTELTEGSVAHDHVLDGYLTEDFFEDKGWIAFAIQSGTPAILTTDNGNDDKDDDHFIEFTFKVKEDAEGEGFLYIPDGSLMTPTNKYAYTMIQRSKSETSFAVNVSEKASRMLYDISLQDKNTIKLEAAEATKYAVTYSYTGDVPEGFETTVPTATEAEEGATISKPVVENIPDGYTLTWTATGATDNGDGTFTVGAGAVAFLGTWTKTAPETYAVTYTYANEAPAGAAAAPAAGTTTAGATINPGITAPAGYTLTWAVTGATDNGDGTYTAGANDVEFVGTWAAIEYDVTYSYANEAPAGAAAAPAAGTTTVGATINPGITAPAGYTLTWAVTGATDNGDGTYKAGANDVEFVGTWAAIEYDVTYSYANEAPAGAAAAPAAGKTTVGATINPGITAPAGYTLTWAVTGATDNGDGTYKAGANDVEFVGTWAAIEYDVTYSYANEAPAGAAAAPAAGKTTVGATINPGITAPAGYTLTWAVTGATDNGDGTYTAGANDVEFVGTWNAVEYDVTYSYANEAPAGAAAAPAAGKTTVGATINPGITAPAGYTLTWAVTGATDNGDGTYTAGANDVEFVGTWNTVEYDVTYSFANEGPDGVDAPAAGKTTVGATINPGITAPDGYTLTWAVTGATDNGDGTYTAGANDVEFVGTWAKKSYTITYYLSEQDKADGKVYDTQTFEFGEAVAAIEDPKVAGKAFDAWDIDVPSTMPAENLEAVAIFSDYIVTFYDVFGDELTDYTMTAVSEITEADLPSAEDATAGEDVTFVEWQVDGVKLATPYSVEGDVDVYPYCTVDVVYYSIYEGEDSENNVVHKEYTFEYGHEITEADLADLGTPVRTGYRLDDDMPWDNDLLYAIVEANTYAVANWIANEYDATFTAGDGEFAEGTVTTVKATYGKAIEFTAEPTLEGYSFKGWTDVEGGAALDELVMDAEGKTFYPVFVMNGSADFYIELYLMNTEGKYEATPDKTLTENGVVGVTAYADHEGCQQYVDDWFSADTSEDADNVYSNVIEEDGSTTLKLYYKRAQYDVVIDGAAAVKVYHGATVTAPSTSANTPAGYELASWNNGAYTMGQEIEVTGALTLTPDFVAGTSTYTIKTYTMGLDGEYGDAVEATDTYTTDETVTYTAPAVEGFKADKDSYSVKVTGDNLAVIEVYYARNQYDVTIDGAAAVKVYHGATVTAPSTSANTPAGYELASWNNGAYTMGQEIEVTGDLTLTPDFVAGTSTYTIKTYTMGLDGEYGDAVEATDTYTTDETVTYTAPAVEGFKADKDSYSVKVTGDNKAVIEVYYIRNQYDVTIDGAASKAYHGATVTAPETSTATPAGYVLESWNDGAYAKGEVITVTGPLTLAPKFAAGTSEYTINTYTMGLDGEYGAAETETKTYTTDETVTYTAPDKEGFKADKESYSVVVTGDGNAVIEVYYIRNQYDVTIDGVTTKAYHGAKITAPETTTATVPAGFTFTGWNNGAYAKGQEIEVTEALTLTPDIVANDATDYSVEIYLQDAEGNYAETASKVETESGKTGEEITIAHADYAQEDYYLADDAEANVFTGTIAGDGSLVLALYYKRATYDIIVDGEVVAEDVIHGAEITLPEESDNIDEGNELDGWTDGKNTYEPGETIVVEGALDLTPVQKPSNATKYTISIYMMDTDGNDYVGTSTVSYGTTGATQTIVPDYSREGFTVNTEKSKLTGTIAADGSLVLSVYYDRNLYTATFDGVDYQVYYGASLPEVEPAAQEGKEFDAWTPAVPATMPADDLEFTSTWTDVMYKIIYIINGTEEEYEYAAGAAVTPRENPTVPGMTFIKWNKTIPETMPAEDVIIVAEFEAAVFKVTFVDADGKVFDEKAVQYGDTIVLPASNPTKEYHVFKGWIDVPETMPAANITIYPDFERVPVRLVAAEGSTTQIDRTNMIITGLKTKFSDAKADNYLAIEGDGYYTLTPVEGYTGYYGTGAKVEVYDNADTSAPIEVFYIVIYGDVNGDSAVNSLDGSLVEDESMYVSSWSRGDTKDELKVMAADLNKDGKVTANDANDIVNTALGITSIDQVTGTVIR